MLDASTQALVARVIDDERQASHDGSDGPGSPARPIDTRTGNLHYGETIG